jgi:hypothetical protein
VPVVTVLSILFGLSVSICSVRQTAAKHTDSTHTVTPRCCLYSHVQTRQDGHEETGATGQGRAEQGYRPAPQGGERGRDGLWMVMGDDAS